MFSLLLDTLVIRSFSYNLATRSAQGEGALGYMAWATTLTQFPQGLVATAISIAILPTLSRQAALMTAAARAAFRDTLGLGLRLAITLILPATAALFVLATPVIALLFEHGAFTAADTQITATALRLYLPGLPFAALDLLLVYAFYARQDTLTPRAGGRAQPAGLRTHRHRPVSGPGALQPDDRRQRQTHHSRHTLWHHSGAPRRGPRPAALLAHPRQVRPGVAGDGPGRLVAAAGRWRS